MDSKLDDKQWVIEYISNWIKKATRFKVEIIRLIPQNEACTNCGLVEIKDEKDCEKFFAVSLKSVQQEKSE